jgi:hypothetical protein
VPRFVTVNNVGSYTRRAGGISDLLSRATSQLGGLVPLHYWDFTTNRALFAGADVGGVADTPGWSYARASVATAQTVAGEVVEFASGVLRRTDRGLPIEDTRTNVFLNSAVGVTQGFTVAAIAYTLSFYGTGTITLSGVSTAGPLVGTGASNRVSLNFTPTAGVLTCTVSGTCTNVQLEPGVGATTYIPVAGVSVVRSADVLSVSSPGVTYPLTMFIEYEPSTILTTGSTLLRTDDGTAGERALLGITAAALARAVVADGGVTQADLSVGSAIVAGTTYKHAARISTNSIQICRSGTLGTEDTVATMPATPSVIRFGAGDTGITQPFVYIRRAAIFNTALADAALQSMTA